MNLIDSIYLTFCEIFIFIFDKTEFIDSTDEFKVPVVFIGATIFATIIFCNIFWIILTASNNLKSLPKVFLFCNLFAVFSVVYSVLVNTVIFEFYRDFLPVSLKQTRINIGPIMYFFLVNTFILLLASQIPLIISFAATVKNKYCLLIKNHELYFMFFVSVSLMPFLPHDVIYSSAILVLLILYCRIGYFLEKRNIIFGESNIN